MASTTLVRIARLAGVVAASLVVSAVVAGIAPGDTVVCGRGHVLNRLVQAVMQPLGAGHIDGATATYCVVPSTIGWLLAIGVFVVIVGTAIAVARRQRTASHQ